MEGKKRDRLPFFNQVFLQLIEDYRNNKADLSLNIVEAFKQLEAAEVDPSLLAYSVVLNKDPDEYQSYTPQHKIGTSMNKEAGSLIKYYKTGLEEDGYKGYSTNYQGGWDWATSGNIWYISYEVVTMVGSEGTVNANLQLYNWESGWSLFTGSWGFWVEFYNALNVPGYWISVNVTGATAGNTYASLSGAGGGTTVSMAVR
jgi:hypothetical protein